MATFCIAPTSVQVSNSLMTPGENILLSWSGAVAGTGNPIIGYLVQYRDDTSSDWSEYCTVFTELTTYMTTCSVPLARGTYRYWRITTIGLNDSTITGTRLYSTIVNCKVNRLPFAPVVVANKTQVPVNGTNGEKTVTFTITADITADDVGEVQTFSYSTTLAGAKTTIVSGGGVLVTATTTFYIWSYDGLEYSNVSTQIVVTKNTLPSISSVTSVPFYSTVGPNSKVITTKVTMTTAATSVLAHSLRAYYRFEYSATVDFASPTYGSYITGDLIPTATLITSAINNGQYFKIRAKVIDQTFTSDYSESLNATIYYMPKLPDAYGSYISLKPINEKTSVVMTDYTLGGVNFYRHWFQYGCTSFAANHTNGYGEITLAKVYFNDNVSGAILPTIATGTVASTLINVTTYTEATAPTTISSQLLVQDEFGQEQIMTTTTTSKDLTKLTDTLVINNAVTYSGTATAGKTGLAVYDIDDFTLAFANLKASYPNSFNYSAFNPALNATYQKISFLSSNQTIHTDDYQAAVNGSLVTTVTLKTRSTFGVGTTTGLLNATTKIINSATNDSNLIIFIYDHFGVVHQLKLTTALNIDFRATPKQISGVPNGLVDITCAGWTNPFLATDEFYGVYKDQILNLKFSSLVFSDDNIDNGGSDSIKTRVYIYEGATLLKTISPNWDCSSLLSSYNLTLSEVNLGAWSNKKTITIQLAAYDNTGLESSVGTRYSIGTFIVFNKNLPTINLTQLSYAGAMPNFTITSSYTYAYNVTNSSYVGTYETVYAAKNVTLKLEGYTPLTGTQTTISAMTGIIPASTKTGSNSLVFTLSNNLNKQTITPHLTITVTFHDGTTITIDSNTFKLKFGEPTVSVRPNRVSVNKTFEDIPAGIISDGVLYINGESDTYNKVYLTHTYNSITHTIIIDLSTSEIDGAIISGGTY